MFFTDLAQDGIAFTEDKSQLLADVVVGSFEDITRARQTLKTGSVHLSGAQLTDAGLEHLKRLPTLTSVMLDECPNLTQAAVKELSHVLRRHMHEIAD
jgi:hypothetical protein